MRALLLDTLGVLLVGLLAWWGVDAAVDAAVSTHFGEGEGLLSVDEVSALALNAYLQWAAGIALLLLGRWRSLSRRGRHLMLPGMLPALTAVLALGLCVQMAYGNPVDPELLWPGPAFASGCLLACVCGFGVLIAPLETHRSMERLPGSRMTVLLGALLAVIFGALLLFGEGPGTSSAKINLGPFQPLELVKVLFVVLLAIVLGDRSAQLRYHRTRKGWLRFPKPRHLRPAVLALLAIVALLFAVDDLGIVLILSGIFLVLFFVATGATGWVGVALSVVGGAVGLLALNPTLGPGAVEKRLQMWIDPWLNGRRGGEQLAESLWAIASGGVHGRGLGESWGSLPAGHTDLIQAHLAEEMGVLGLWGYLGLLAVLVFSGFWVAARCRTPRTVLLATGLAVLLLVQWAVIFAGTFGLMPLTGVVAPFLSAGKSSMVVFVAVVAVLMRLGEGGASPIAGTDELDHLHKGLASTWWAAAGVLALGALAVFYQGAIVATATASRGVITYQAPDSTRSEGYWVLRFNPRLVAVAAEYPRGPILDRNGAELAGIDENGARTYPLGDALGTLLAPVVRGVESEFWSLEKQNDERLRGYPESVDPPGKWVALNGTERPFLLGVAHVSREEATQSRARALATERFGEGVEIALLTFDAPDYRALVPLMRMGASSRAEALAEIAAQPEKRTVQLTLDAGLQKAASEAVKTAAAKGKSASAVVLNAATGEVLARAQWPDLDVTDTSWVEKRRSHEAEFMGVYGPWKDKTGPYGVYQAGSVGKVFTAMAAVRSGSSVSGSACSAEGGQEFACSELDGGRPSFKKEDWTRSIRDHRGSELHGDIGLVDALRVSCNVYFAQLALELGPEPLEALVADGLEVRWGGATMYAGDAGGRMLAETGFGQGAMAMSVTQAARMVATAGDGHYRRCAADLKFGSDCEDTTLFEDPTVLAPVMAGMRKVIDSGTARSMTALKGVRVYGKTGTADDPVRGEEAPYGVTSARPHSWFVALAEPGEGRGCGADNSDRLAVAVVATRAGYGSTVAMPAARAIIGAANTLGYFGETEASE